MKAIILAGGKGTRLAPYTTVLPKPLMPIGDKPILEIVIRQLVKHGFDDVTMAVGYHAELIMAYCGDGSKYGAKIAYSKEDKPMGTAGPLSLISDLKDTFLVMNGDLLTDLNFKKMLDNHRRRREMATLAVYKKEVKIDLGVVKIDENNYIGNYIEKPVYDYDVSSGIYIFEPSVLRYLKEGIKCDLPELILRLLGDGMKVNSFRLKGYWLDIGRHEDYENAVLEYENNPRRFI
ncbi:MAG: sugar phosphate nucleotidyltransferase [Victivallales bacterium]